MRILFLCTGNACRSQMAEAWARRFSAPGDEIRSAGTRPAGLDPRVAVVMGEVGIDVSAQRSESVELYRDQAFDLVVTVCDAAREACPRFPGTAETLHHPFPDPPRLAAEAADEEGRLQAYRRVRDEIRAFVEELFTNRKATTGSSGAIRRDDGKEGA